MTNLIGIGIYLALASRLWPASGEENTPGGPGDAFFCFFVIWPLLLFFLSANLMMLFRVIRRSSGRRSVIVLWIVMALFWIATVLIDHSQGVRLISPEYT
ncbi:hypothetical protein BTM36_17595 [Herbaspirillum sp. VT-16-41]|nr:hypothetical protein BTM36_17595 [Herbaspirillum sp. VT-16-41]